MKKIQSYKLYNESLGKKFVNESLRDKLKGKPLNVIDDDIEQIIEDVLNELVSRRFIEDLDISMDKFFNILEHEYKQMIIDMVSEHGLNSEQMVELIIENFEDTFDYENFEEKYKWMV